MIIISYFLLFLFVISCSQTFFSFMYGITVHEHNNHFLQVKHLTKQTIHLAVHLLLLLPTFVLLLFHVGVSLKMYPFIAVCSGIFVGFALLRIICNGFQYVTTQ